METLWIRGGVMSEYKINILGQEMTIKSDDELAHVRAVEAMVNAQVEDSPGEMPIANALIIASLKLADELVRERDRHSELKERIRSRSSALLEQLNQKFAY
jgi:cell division protein ZapA (FtsZ GTPase activity inhibitor)